MIKISHLVSLTGCALSSGGVNAFSQYASSNVISVAENAPRDVYTMDDWAVGCGAQKSEGFELTSYDGQDYYAATNQDIPAGSPVLFVPNQMMITSSAVAQEYGQGLAQAENELVQYDCGELVPMFRLFIKILIEFEKGTDSPWFAWLNSLPRFYNTGASMTYACFECLPPYAAWLAVLERKNSVNFQKAAKFAQYDNIISEETAGNTEVLKWAYNVATTRSIERNGELFIAPLADMFNHGTEVEVDINYDEEGNCMVYSSRDIPAGSPLRMSLGDPTNPSPLFAKYGFLDDSSPATFCKVMHLIGEMQELGYDFSNLLFYKETGDISPEVYDVVLYSILGQDPNLKQGFYEACINGDIDTKNQYIEQYYPNIIEALRSHVDVTLLELDQLSAAASSKDPNTHPRVGVILQHNAFVKETFLKVKSNLDNM
mmetsp:Transcript_39179/g.44122  ORF Transcript_39179/g.44122 Transcript_39179/m.44122 type:complete len:430 (-) Transcript_39179:25-1314(-)